jgi:hypothetical protein
MKKLIVALMAGAILIGCSKSEGDIFLGKWSSAKNPSITLEVTKHDGGSGYTVTRYANGTRVVETYTGVADGKTIALSSAGGVIPVEMKGAQLSVDLLPGCYESNCVLWNKVSN